MTKEISCKQAGILLSLSIISIKFLLFPAILARYAYDNAYISLLLSFLLDTVIIIGIVLVMNKYPDKTFKDILTESYGKIVTKIVFFVLSIYMFCKCVIIIKELHNYFLQSLYDQLSWFKFIVPLIPILIYMASKKVKVLARSSKVFYYFVLFAIFITLAVSITDMDFGALLPLFPNGFKPIAQASYKSAFAYGDFVILFVVMGNINFKKHKAWPIFYYALFSFLIVFVFEICFIAMFKSVSVNKTLAFSAIPLNSSLSSTVGRFDWLAIILWIITMMLQAGFFLLVSVDYMHEVIPGKRYVPLTILILALISVLDIFYFSLSKVSELITSTPFVIFSLCVQIGVPLLLYIATFIKGRKEYANSKKAVKE